MLKRAALTLTLLFAIPVEAHACGTSPSFALIHSSLPKSIPQELFVAEIEIEPDDPDKAYGIGLKARVLKVVSGALVDGVILRLPERTSCDSLLANGRSGFIVAVPKEWSGKSLVVWPLLVSRFDDFRLSDDVNLKDLLSHVE